MPETRIQFESLSGAKLVEGYGLSEAPTATHCNPIGGENRLGSIGLPLPDVECKIVCPDDDELVLPPGEAGELLVRGPQVMQGYFQNSAETRISLKGVMAAYWRHGENGFRRIFLRGRQDQGIDQGERITGLAG
jgi:long-chain acyl-CoA synthetase